MTTPLRFAAALVAVIAVGLLAITLLKLPGSGATPTVTAGQSATPATTPSPNASATQRAIEPSSTPVAAAPGAAFPSGVIPAGTYHSVAFTPTVVVTLPDGWSYRYQDAQGLILARGGLLLFFTHEAATVTPAALGQLPAGETAAPVTLGQYAGFAAGPGPGGATLLTDSGLRPWDSDPSSVTWSWVVGVEGRPLGIVLNGPPDEATAALPEVRAFLATLGVAP